MALRQIARTLVGFLLIVSAGVALPAQAQNWDGSGLIRFGVFLQGATVDYAITQTPPGAASFRESASPDGLVQTSPRVSSDSGATTPPASATAARNRGSGSSTIAIVPRRGVTVTPVARA